MIAKNIWVAFR